MTVQWDYDLNFILQPQETTEWCFAAVAASVSLWYDNASAYTQSQLAGDQFGGIACLPRSTDPACNPPGGGQLDIALAETGNFANQQTGVVDIPRLEVEFAMRRVVAARVQWRGGESAHFVVISNAAKNQGMLRINDPRPCVGTLECSYDAFMNNYSQAKGVWSDTYFTQPKGGPAATGIPPVTAQAFAQAAQQSGGSAPKLPAAHRNLAEARAVYVADIDVLANGSGLGRARLAGWENTVFEPDGGAYTLHVNAETPDTISFRTRNNSAREHLTTIHDATRILSSTSYEVRSLRIPSIYVSALWLKAASDQDDVIIPVGLLPNSLTPNTHYDRPTIEPILQHLAQGRIRRPTPGRPIFR